jgi:hypothetical protein
VEQPFETAKKRMASRSVLISRLTMIVRSGAGRVLRKI